MWSLGCLLYELATLTSPFHSPAINFYLLGKRIMSRKFEPIPEGYSEALRGCVDRMLREVGADGRVNRLTCNVPLNNVTATVPIAVSLNGIDFTVR